MALSRKVQDWQVAGIIDAATAQRILEFEKKSAGPKLLFALVGLASLAIAIGIIAIIASNWDQIDASTKLAADFALLLMVGSFIAQKVTAIPIWVREALIFIFFGLVLASIALIGQIFQLSGPLWRTLLLWLIIASPVAFLARSSFLAVTWMISIWVMMGSAMSEFSAQIKELHLFYAIGWVFPFVPMYLSFIPWLVRRRSQFAETFRNLSILAFVVLCFSSSFAWYSSRPDSFAEGWRSLFACAMMMGGLCWLERSRRKVFLIGGLMLLLAHGQLLFTMKSAEMAAIQFILIGFVLAWAGHLSHRPKLITLASALIAARIIAIYFELFSTLLETGVFLIGGGLFTLAMIYGWVKFTRFQGKRLGGGQA
mgnify:CR=1 FL=1